jgi:hypothetical protein
MRTPLCDLAEKHGTNKCSEGYTPFYYDLLRDRHIQRVLEVGIGGPGLSGGASKLGASLKMWSEFLPSAGIYGLDVKRELLFNEGNIQTYWADVEQPETLIAAAAHFGGHFGLIIDDAVHLPGPQISTALTLLPFLAPDGTYVIEDVANCHPDDITRNIPNTYTCHFKRCTNWPLVVIFHR